MPEKQLLELLHSVFHSFHTLFPSSQAATFSQVLESDEGSDEKAITAMGLLNTIEALLTVMEEQPEIIAQLQPIVLQVVGHIFQQSVMGETRATLTQGDYCCNGLSTTNCLF